MLQVVTTGISDKVRQCCVSVKCFPGKASSCQVLGVLVCVNTNKSPLCGHIMLVDEYLLMSYCWRIFKFLNSLYKGGFTLGRGCSFIRSPLNWLLNVWELHCDIRGQATSFSKSTCTKACENREVVRGLLIEGVNWHGGADFINSDRNSSKWWLINQHLISHKYTFPYKYLLRGWVDRNCGVQTLVRILSRAPSVLREQSIYTLKLILY